MTTQEEIKKRGFGMQEKFPELDRNEREGYNSVCLLIFVLSDKSDMRDFLLQICYGEMNVFMLIMPSPEYL